MNTVTMYNGIYSPPSRQTHASRPRGPRPTTAAVTHRGSGGSPRPRAHGKPSAPQRHAMALSTRHCCSGGPRPIGSAYGPMPHGCGGANRQLKQPCQPSNNYPAVTARCLVHVAYCVLATDFRTLSIAYSILSIIYTALI